MLPFAFTLYRFGRAIWSALKDPEFRTLFILVIAILASGTVFYHEVESFRWIDALYFSVTTLATVGFGDLSPHTDIGKAFTIVYILVGIGILFGFIEVIAEHARSNTSKARRAKKENT